MSWSSGPAAQGPGYQRQPRHGFFNSLRFSGWYRAQPRIIGGVCSGISARMGWDLSLVRILTVVAAVIIPVAVIAYALAWLFLPEAADGRIHVEETAAGRFDIAVVGGAFMVFIGLSSIGFSTAIGVGWPGLTELVGFVVVVLLFAFRAASKGNANNGGQAGPAFASPHASSASSPAPGPAAPGATASSAPSPGAGGPQGPHAFGPGGTPGGMHPGWVPPAAAPQPRRWSAPPAPTHRPRSVSARVNLAVTGLLILVVAAMATGMYLTGLGRTIPFVTGEDAAQTMSRLVVISGGTCLLIVGLCLSWAALRDRTAAWLMTLSIIGVLFAIPTALIGTEATHGRLINPGPAFVNTSSSTTLDWTTDHVQVVSRVSSTTLDLTGAPVGTTKTISVSTFAPPRLTIQATEGQPVQVLCQSSITSVSTNMSDDGWAASLNKCPGQVVSSPSWGKAGLGGITILIDDDADLDELTIVSRPDASHTWEAGDPASPHTPSPSTAPSTSPSPTPADTQSGN